jgi:hypothetical protein
MGKINSKHHYIDYLNTTFDEIEKQYYVPVLQNEFETYNDYIDVLFMILLSDDDFRKLSDDFPLPISLHNINNDHNLYDIDMNVYYTTIDENKAKINPECVRVLSDVFDYPKNIMIKFNKYKLSLNINNNIMIETRLRKKIKV